MTTKTIAELAQYLQLEFQGDGQCEISGIAPLQHAQLGQISFLDNRKYKQHLADTKASAVICKQEFAEQCPCAVIISQEPYYTFALLTHIFSDVPRPDTGIHPSAVIADSAEVDPSASIGPNVVIESGTKIGKNVVIQACSYIGDGVTIGDNTRIWPNVSIYYRVVIGQRVNIHSGVVIGADGFGIAKHKGQWQKVAQLGSVIIGDDVDIGANTSIDRGALNDTIIDNGVKLDNLIQIGHNVEIGEHTAIAGCAAIAGSTKIGRDCLIGGGACISGHLTITDNIVITGMSGVSSSLSKPDIYSGGTKLSTNREWRKNTARLANLDNLVRRLFSLEKKIEKQQTTEEE